MTVNEAAEMLGIDSCSIYAKGTRYNRYLIRGAEGTRYSAKFDMVGYQAELDLRAEFIAKTNMFLEYLIHEGHIPVKKLSKFVSINETALYSGNLGFDLCCRLIQKTPRKYVVAFDRFFML